MLDLKIPVDIYDQDLKKINKISQQNRISSPTYLITLLMLFKKILGGSIHHWILGNNFIITVFVFGVGS